MVANEWREHDGVRYLHVVYGPDRDVAVEVSAETSILLAAEPEGTLVRVLVDVRDAQLTGWPNESMTRARKDAAMLARRLNIRGVVIGARGPLVALLRGMSLVSSRVRIVAAPSEEKALAYLTRE